MALYNNDTRFAADVTEGLVVGARDDVATVAAHEAELVGGGGRRVRLIPGIGVAGARRRVDRVRVVEMSWWWRRDGGGEWRSRGRDLHGWRRSRSVGEILGAVCCLLSRREKKKKVLRRGT